VLKIPDAKGVRLRCCSHGGDELGCGDGMMPFELGNVNALHQKIGEILMLK